MQRARWSHAGTDQDLTCCELPLNGEKFSMHIFILEIKRKTFSSAGHPAEQDVKDRECLKHNHQMRTHFECMR